MIDIGSRTWQTGTIIAVNCMVFAVAVRLDDGTEKSASARLFYLDDFPDSETDPLAPGQRVSVALLPDGTIHGIYPIQSEPTEIE